MEFYIVIVILVRCILSASAFGNNFILSKREEYVENHPIQNILSEGMELAMKHCNQQFQNEPWNCPAKDFLTKHQNPMLDRESAFVQSITVAAIAYTVAKNCSGSDKEKDSFCGCAFKEQNGVMDLYECFKNMASEENELSQIVNKLTGGEGATYDPQGIMLLQNTRAGLYTVMSSVQKTCRCHGFSGSCSISTCWLALDSFNKIARHLKSLYLFAEPLQMKNNMNMDHLLLSDMEMVYLDESPNYCSSPKNLKGKAKKSHAWESVRGRTCATSQSSEDEKQACSDLCADCGLRMRWKEVTAKRSCNCKFNWCCNVKCDVCEDVVKEFYCA